MYWCFSFILLGISVFSNSSRKEESSNFYQCSWNITHIGGNIYSTMYLTLIRGNKVLHIYYYFSNCAGHCLCCWHWILKTALLQSGNSILLFLLNIYSNGPVVIWFTFQFIKVHAYWINILTFYRSVMFFLLL